MSFKHIKIFISVILLSVAQFISAQSTNIKEADLYFRNFNYKKAISLYKQCIKEKDQANYSTQKIALAYSKLGDNRNSVIWFKKCLEFSETDPNNHLLLAQELLKTGNVNEASEYFNKYYGYSDTPHQLSSLSFLEYFNSLMADSLRYEISPLALNSRYAEFGPVFYKNKIVFTSNRPQKEIIKQTDIQTGENFFNIYIANKTSSNVELFSKELQSKFNDGPVFFAPDFKTAYVTRNTNITKGINILDIFLYYRNDNKWVKEIRPLPIRKGSYSVAHAYSSPDAGKLFFSSNMPGGYGGMDIYMSEIKDGFLGQPKNLGSKINTSGNEIFPFLTNEGTLYFSSDMHPGIGGYDIFFSKDINGQFTIPFNLGYPQNSAFDDFSLVLDQSNMFGYFASNRPGGYGEDDIYSIKINQPLDFCLIQAQVLDKTDLTRLNNVIINITEDEANTTLVLKSDENGSFNCYLKKDKKYIFTINQKEFSKYNVILTSEDLKKSDVLELNIMLKAK